MPLERRYALYMSQGGAQTRGMPSRRRRLGRLALRLAILLALPLACGEPSAPSPSSASPSGEAPREVKVSVVPRVFLDFVAESGAAHVRWPGPLFGPDAPGWEKISRLGQRGPWQPGRKEGLVEASWLDGIGGSFHFSVDKEGADLTHLQLWLRPVAPGQRVSLFLDERPLQTLSLKPGGHLYTLPLPAGGLAPGEHSLRFWFRFTRSRAGLRTPGAVGQAQLFGAEGPKPWPATWSREVSMAGVKGPALLAGPPLVWAHYLLPPKGARFSARVAVSHGGPVTFLVRAERDGHPPQVLHEIKVEASAVAEINLDLSSLVGAPTRLELESQGEGGGLDRAAWIEPMILIPGRAVGEIPACRNLIVWVIDGLRGDRVALDGHDSASRAATPNMALLRREGAAAVDLWSAGAAPREGHRQLLAPLDAGPNLATALAAAGLRTGLLSTSRDLPEALSEPFSTRQEVHRSGEPIESALLLRDLDGWLDARGRARFFLYIASQDPVRPGPPPAGYTAFYDRSRPGPKPREVMLSEARARLELEQAQRAALIDYDARVSAADYWVGQMFALLEKHGLVEDTAVVIVGSTGARLDERDEGQRPGWISSLEVPLILWHPQLRATRPRAHMEGGDLSDVSKSLFTLVGVPAPSGWPGVELLTAALYEVPFPHHPSQAKIGRVVVARFGGWVLQGLTSRELKLWSLSSGEGVDLESSHPITLRTLRDHLSSTSAGP